MSFVTRFGLAMGSTLAAQERPVRGIASGA